MKIGEDAREEKISRLKVEIYDLRKDAERLQLSIQKIAQVIQAKNAEIEELEKVREIRQVKEEVKPS